MREIKVRFFDTQNEGDLRPEMSPVAWSPTELMRAGARLGLSLNPEHGTWLEFTGFKDAGGTEIFEGDILCYEKKINLPGKPGAHKIENHYWEVFMSPKGQWCMRRGEVAHALFGSNEKHTVAGNIFETPDLLK